MNPINETRHPTTPSLELPREVGVSDIAIVLAVFIGFLLLLGILFGVVLGVSNLALAATEAVSFAMAANAFRGRAKTTLMRYLDLRKTTAMAYIAGLCLSLGCVVPIAELNSLVVRAIPAPPAMREVLTMVAQSGGLFGAIAFAVVVAPLA